MIEERICKLEDESVEIIQNEEHREKRLENNDQSRRDMLSQTIKHTCNWNTKWRQES